MLEVVNKDSGAELTEDSLTVETRIDLGTVEEKDDDFPRREVGIALCEEISVELRAPDWVRMDQFDDLCVKEVVSFGTEEEMPLSV